MKSYTRLPVLETDSIAVREGTSEDTDPVDENPDGIG